MKLLGGVDEQVGLVLGVVELCNAVKEFLQEWDRLLDEDRDDEVRDFLEAVEDNVLLPAARALHKFKKFKLNLIREHSIEYDQVNFIISIDF